MDETWIVKYPDNCKEETGVKIKKHRGCIEIIQFVETDMEEIECEKVQIEKGIVLNDLIKYLKEIKEEEYRCKN